MGTYDLPRDVKGEGRILFIFSTKALIWSVICGAIGIPFYILFNIFDLGYIGFIIIAVFGLVGFGIGTFKMPESSNFQITKKTGGENIDDVIRRAIKFKMQKGKIYVYNRDYTSIENKEEETKDEK